MKAPSRLQLVLLVSAGALCALLWLVLPPVLFRLEDTLGGGGGAAPAVSAHTGPGPAHGAPDAAWNSWAPFTVPDGGSGSRDAPVKTAQLQAEGATPVRAVARSRVGAAPPGFTVQQAERAAARVSPDLFAALPASFLKEYKAPCWRTEENKLRCLPYFYILGVFQCGVRDLMARVLLHKRAASTLNAAPSFWDEIHPFSEYLALFEPALPKVEAFPTSAVFGDGSLSTFTYTWTGSERLHAEWTAAFRACRENDCDNGKQPCVDDTCYARANEVPVGGGANLTLPYLLRAALGAGNAKLVVLLRDPVERLHAAYHYYDHYGRTYGRNASGFTSYVTEMTLSFRRCLDAGHAELQCVTAYESLGPSYEATWYHCDAVLKSLYAPFLEGYLAAFPREDLLVLRFEDYADGSEAAMRATLQLVFKHLEMDEPDAASWKAMLSAPVTRNGVAAQPSRPPMDPGTRTMLKAFYRPYNQRLSALLDDDPRWLWD